MTHRRPLPAPLRGTTFTSDERALHEVSRNRLKAADITTLSRGVYRSASETLPATELEAQDTAAMMRKVGAVLSHRSAARWHGIPLPAWLDGLDGLEVTVPHRQHTSVRAGLQVHRRPLPEAHALIDQDVRVTTPERTWCDLASLLRPGQEGHLVAAGDYLVTPPWTLDGREEALSSIGDLQRALTASARFKGVRLARTALPLIRVGADSVPETLLRLGLVDAGLPEPELQVLADPEDQGSPAADLGYRQWKIAMQHDGAHHRTPEQQERDARRDAWFQAHGWMAIRVTAADIRDGYARVIALVKGRARAMATGQAA